MKKKYIVLLSSLLMSLSALSADFTLHVKAPTKEEQRFHQIGKLDINSTNLGTNKSEGKFTIVAKRLNNQLTIQVLDKDTKVVGKAESVVGLAETPVYFKTTQGLKSLTLIW